MNTGPIPAPTVQAEALPSVSPADRAHWLRARKTGVGASEVAAILGVDPRRGPLAVYAAKLTDDVAEEEVDYLEFGRDVEGAIAKGFRRRTGRPVETLGALTILRHASAPLSATLDFLNEGNEKHPAPAPGKGPLECKAVNAFKKDEWAADPPMHFVVQLQAQMAVTGADWGTLCALIGGIVPVWMDIPRNQRFIDQMLVAVDVFWRRVETQNPPEPDALPGTLAALRALYPRDTGDEITMPYESVEDVARLKAAKVERAKCEEVIDLAEARLKAVLGPATWGRLPDGTYLKWKVEPRKEHLVAASEPRVFRLTKSR